RSGLAGLLALLGVGLVVAALVASRDEQPLIWPERAGSAAALGPTLETVLTHADAYYGRDVTLGGRVGRLVAPRAFTLREGAQEFLVVAQYGLPPVSDLADRPLAVGDPVGVTGAVRAFDLAFFQRDLGYDLDAAPFRAWEHRPAVIALWIDRSP